MLKIKFECHIAQSENVRYKLEFEPLKFTNEWYNEPGLFLRKNHQFLQFEIDLTPESLLNQPNRRDFRNPNSYTLISTRLKRGFAWKPGLPTLSQNCNVGVASIPVDSRRLHLWSCTWWSHRPRCTLDTHRRPSHITASSLRISIILWLAFALFKRTDLPKRGIATGSPNLALHRGRSKFKPKEQQWRGIPRPDKRFYLHPAEMDRHDPLRCFQRSPGGCAIVESKWTTVEAASKDKKSEGMQIGFAHCNDSSGPFASGFSSEILRYWGRRLDNCSSCWFSQMGKSFTW